LPWCGDRRRAQGLEGVQEAIEVGSGVMQARSEDVHLRAVGLQYAEGVDQADFAARGSCQGCRGPECLGLELLAKVVEVMRGVDDEVGDRVVSTVRG